MRKRARLKKLLLRSLERRCHEVSELPRHEGKKCTPIRALYSNRLIVLNLTKQFKTRISRRQRVCMHKRAYATWLKCLCGVATFSREQRDVDRSTGEGQCPSAALVPPTLVPPTHLPLAWSDAHGSRNSARRACLRASLQERPGTTPQLRKKPPLAVTRNILEYPLWILACGEQAAHTATKE